MADEINRASPRTQSALLQAMQERTVTVSGQNWQLGSPFHVLATQNPIEQEGTYPLPEAQLDRFMLEIQVQYPDRSSEREILLATTGTKEISVSPVFDPSQILAAQTLIRRMPVGDSVVELILDLVRAFRPEDPSAPDLVKENMRWGPGPRASQALMLAVRAQALLRGDLAPSAVDVASLAPAVLNHRMAMGFAAQSRGMTHLELISEVTNLILQKKGVA
jgi:MoxR-like ATPase